MNKNFASALAATLLVAGTAMAQTPEPLSAQASNPQAMGWMQGFPPSADKTIRFTDPDYFAFPRLRWTVCNFRQLMPSVGVNNGTKGARGLPAALETATPGNLAIYEALGFRVTGTYQIKGGPQFWSMWREPLGR